MLKELGALLIVATLSPAAQAQTSAAPLLLRVASVEAIEEAGQPLVTRQEALIFRDGLVIAKRTRSGEAECEILRGTASARAMNSLLQDLSRNKVATQVGNCFLPDVVSGSLNGSYVITWLGKAPRQHTFEVGEQFLDACPTSTYNIVLSARSLVAAEWTAADASVARTVCKDPSMNLP